MDLNTFIITRFTEPHSGMLKFVACYLIYYYVSWSVLPVKIQAVVSYLMC